MLAYLRWWILIFHFSAAYQIQLKSEFSWRKKKLLWDLNLRSTTEEKWQWKSVRIDTQKNVPHSSNRWQRQQFGFQRVFFVKQNLFGGKNLLKMRQAAVELCKNVEGFIFGFFVCFLLQLQQQQKCPSRALESVNLNYFSSIIKKSFNEFESFIQQNAAVRIVWCVWK